MRTENMDIRLSTLLIDKGSHKQYAISIALVVVWALRINKSVHK